MAWRWLHAPVVGGGQGRERAGEEENGSGEEEEKK